MSSPDNRLRVDVTVKEGKPVYGVTYQSATILEDSPLGFVANVGDFTLSGNLEARIEETLAAWEKLYGRSDTAQTTGARFIHVLHQARKRYGRRCVVLIDEYDKPILDVLDTGYGTTIDGERRLLEDRNREILKNFYSVFKTADEDLQFVLLTGVTKFSQVSVFSGFNQPADISMASQYETLCGITQEELEHYFAEPIEWQKNVGLLPKA